MCASVIRSSRVEPLLELSDPPYHEIYRKLSCAHGGFRNPLGDSRLSLLVVVKYSISIA